MLKSYNPFDWYWLSGDGRTYSSARQAKVQKDDAAYLDWIRDGSLPTPWPSDETGSQTDASLQDVLSPYGLRVSPAKPAA